MQLKVLEKDGKIYSHIRKKWLTKTPEDLVRQEYLLVLVNKYGYTLEQIKEEENVTGRGSAQARADFIIYKDKKDILKNDNPLIIIECKADNINISEKDYVQGEIYARIYNAPFFVTHNNKETKYWKVKKDKSPGYRDEIKDIPKVNATDKEINILLTELITFKEGEFKKVLKQCHDIIYQNEKADPVFAFDEIAKILFMKVYAERHLKAEKENVFSLEWIEEAEKYTKDFIDKTFEDTKKEFGKGAIFKDNEKINLDKQTIKAIIKKLEKYYLSATSADIKGIAFEGFLGDTFRSDNGQFFTPRTIVEAMINIINPQPNQIVCDPACGSGGFLIRYFQQVQNKTLLQLDADYQKKKNEIEKNAKLSDKEKTDQIFSAFKETEALSDISNKKSPLFHLANDCIFGSDANERMARTSKMNMIMHGDGHGGIKHQNGFRNVDEITDNAFDIVITNPPFGSMVNDKEILANYTLPNKNPIKEEFLFIERCINLLKEKGKLAIVLPESIFNNPSNNWIREYVENNSFIRSVISIPRETFLSSGADVKCSLLFLQKFTQKEKETWFKTIEEQKELELQLQEKERTELKKTIDSKFNTKETDKEKLVELKKQFAKDKKDAQKRLSELEIELIVNSRRNAKEKFTYPIFMFEADFVGISASGEPIKKNDLPESVSDYLLFSAKKELVNKNSRAIEFKKINRWDVKSYLHSIESQYEFKKLKPFIYEHSEKVKLFNYPEDEFNILGVTNRGGVYLNITDKGSEFNQAYKKASAHELTYNPYRVNVGSIGIVPEEYDGYHISPAYVVFGVKEGLLHEYLYLVLASDWFNPLLRAATTGSVRQNLTYQLLEELEIPFPDIKTQEKIVKQYKALQQKKADIDKQLNSFKEEIKNDILK